MILLAVILFGEECLMGNYLEIVNACGANEFGIDWCSEGAGELSMSYSFRDV